MYRFEKRAINKLPTLFKIKKLCANFLSSPGFKSMTSSTKLISLYPLGQRNTYCIYNKLQIIKNVCEFSHKNENEKFSNYFRRHKGVQEKYLHSVVKSFQHMTG